MLFGQGQYDAGVLLGHVGHREFRRAMLGTTALISMSAESVDAAEIRYEYAVFRDDESIIFNVRPDETGARAVTVSYLGKKGPDQP